MALTVKIINGKAPSGGIGGVSDADLSTAIIDFITPGAKDVNAFKVTPPGASSRTVVIKAGRYYAPNATNTMVYVVDLDADYTLSPTLPTNGSGNPRIDAIALKIDLGTTPNNLANNVASIVSVQGATAVTPTAPIQSDIQTAVGAGNVGVRLGDVTAASGFTTIVLGDISDKRTFATIDGSKLAANSVTQRAIVANASNDFLTGGSGAIGSAATTWYDITKMTKTLTTTGGDLLVAFNQMFTLSAQADMLVKCMIDSSFVGKVWQNGNGNGFTVSGTFLITGVAAGSHTIKLQAGVTTAATISVFTQQSLSIVELKK
jgi:hypothetical protein